MNKNVGYILAFSCGAAAGAFAAWKLLKSKYEKIAQEEIDSVKEHFTKRYEKPTEDIMEAPVEEIETQRDYHGILSDNSYVAPEIEEKGVVEDTEELKPVIISIDEFGYEPDYDTETFNYYNDGVLTDMMNHPVNTRDYIVGTEFVKEFDYTDAVYIRNDDAEMYFEILKLDENYADIEPSIDPHEKED